MRQVVVVDASPAIRRTILKGLRYAGIKEQEVTTFDRADEMIGRFTEIAPEFVLMEAEPVGIDMVDAVQAMLLEEPDVKIVLLVTDRYKQSDAVQDALAFGVFGLLEKPIRVDDVDRLLDTADQEHLGAGRIK